MVKYLVGALSPVSLVNGHGKRTKLWSMDMGRGQGSGKWTWEEDKALLNGHGKRTRLW